MRVCLFSPSLDPLLDDEVIARVRRAHAGGDGEVVCLTNSWADVPENADVHVTAQTRTLAMRTLRRAASADRATATLAARALMPAIGDSLLEGLRAADPDLIVGITRTVSAQLQAIVQRAKAPWPCVSIHDRVRAVPLPTRRYDPGAKVSIILPTYNGVRYLRESIESCLAQTHRHIEIIVVDDGSSEPIERIVRDCDDRRILFVRHERNCGLPTALNTGFAAATGELLTWTSDDNAYLPFAIERMVRFIHTYPHVDFVYAESVCVDEHGAASHVMRIAPPESLARDNYIGACFLYTRKVYETVGDYDPRAELAEDYDYWVRVSQRFTMQRLFRRLYRYRFHGASLTSRHGRSEVVRRVDTVRQHFRRESWAWHR
jgi:GT2 family glycosyltransferase